MPPNKRKKRPKPFTTKEEGEALLFLACKRNYPRKVKTLIDYHDVSSEAFYGKKKNAKGRGITPIIIAARSGHIDIVSTLITLGANVQQEDRNQWNALHWACKRGHFNIARLLISKGLDPRKPNKDNVTPLMLASWWGHLKLVKLLQSGPAGTKNVHLADNTRGWNALIGACKFGRVEIVKILLKLDNIDIHFTDSFGKTALLHTTHPQIIKLLLQHGARPETKDEYTGRNVLHWAADTGSLDVVTTVLDHLSQAHEIDVLLRITSEYDKLTGCSPLMLAKRKDHRPIVSALRSTLFQVYSRK